MHRSTRRFRSDGLLQPYARRIVAEALDVSLKEAGAMIAVAARVVGVSERTMRRRVLDGRISPKMVRRLAEAGGWRSKTEGE